MIGDGVRMFFPETARFRAMMTTSANPTRRIATAFACAVIAMAEGTGGRGTRSPLDACIVSRPVL